MTEAAPWDEAVDDAGVLAPADAMSALREELEYLWSDLGREHHMASNSIWSAGCDIYARRIIRLTRIAGVTHWRKVGYPLLLNGIYHGLLTSAGAEHEMPDLAQAEAWAVRAEIPRCANCRLWSGSHERDCSLRPRSLYERDRERLEA